jgi:hypothetical protein
VELRNADSLRRRRFDLLAFSSSGSWNCGTPVGVPVLDLPAWADRRARTTPGSTRFSTGRSGPTRPAALGPFAEDNKTPAWAGVLSVAGIGVDPMTSRFSGARSAD